MSSFRRRYRFIVIIFLVGLVLTFIISRYYPKITSVEVYYGYDDRVPHYSETEIKTYTDIYEGKAFFNISRKQLKNFAKDPWVEKLQLVRFWPNHITIIVWERKPAVAHYQAQNTYIMYALDGTMLPTMLPNVKEISREKLIILSGWGKTSLTEALKLIKLLIEFEPARLQYSPSGFDINLASSNLFTPNLEALKKHWGAFVSEQHRHQEVQGTNLNPLQITVYDWGISVQ